jgi:hypothetical protein
MTVEEIAAKLSRTEKLQLMEALWADLSAEPDLLESPAWHEAELEKTALRYAQGKEIPIDFEVAKAMLIAER